jgi:hypothetical protein
MVVLRCPGSKNPVLQKMLTRLKVNKVTAIYANTSKPDQMNLVLSLLGTTYCQKDHF